MKKTVFTTVATALAAGFLGGAAAHSLFTAAPVHAQVRIEPPNTPSPNAPIPRPGRRPAPGEITAERFVIVDHQGNVFGVVGMYGDHPEIDLYDKTGKVVWRAPFRAGLMPLAMAH